MKILHTTDLHFNKKWFDWIENQQDNFDIFCITGDFLESRKDETLLEQIAWVTKWMRGFKKPLFVCSGNHDIEDLENENWLDKIPNIYSDGTIKTIDGVKFGCIPYLAPDFFEFNQCDILLYHIPPAKTKTAIHKKEYNDWGDMELYQMIQRSILKPKVLLSGHMHYPTNTVDKIKDTTIYNTGVDKENDIPNFHSIEITD